MQKFATFISKLFEPLLVLFAIMLAGGWHAGLTGTNFWVYIGYILIFFGIIFALRMWLVRRYQLDWDISDRYKRIRPLIMIIMVVLGNWFIIRSWHSAELTNLFSLFVLWLLGFFLITLFYKISGHVSVVTLAAGLVTTWFGSAWWPVWLVVPLVAWARIFGKHHTVGQVIAGIFFSSLILATQGMG